MNVRARWTWLTDGPVENLTLSIACGRIVEISKKSLAATTDLGDVCLMPSLVNAHTHLEFSDLNQPIEPAGSFASWIGQVVQHRRRQFESCATEDPVSTTQKWSDLRRKAFQQGIAESIRGGVGCVVDMVTDPWSPDWTSHFHTDEAPFCLAALGEMLGATQERMDESNSRADRFAEYASDRSSVHPDVSNSISYGLSPHSPYTTPLSLLRESLQRCEGLKTLGPNSKCVANGLVSMHLGESMEELEWITHRSGPLREMLERFAPEFVALPNEPHSLVDYIQLLSQAKRSLVVHGNYLDTASIDAIALARSKMGVVYCPRTHALFDHEPHPWRGLLDKGITVLLGTDSRASNPDLSILEEVRFLHRKFPAIDPNLWIGMISHVAADFLGCGDRIGRIQVGSNPPGLALPCLATSPTEVLESILAT